MIFQSMCWIPFEFYLNGSYVCGPRLSGHHFIACDAHDTWEGNTVSSQTLSHDPSKVDFKAIQTHVKQSTGIYAVIRQFTP